MIKPFRGFLIFCAIGLLSACSSIDPFVEDWDRTRLTQYSTAPLEVRICFDHAYHQRSAVEELAKEECANRIEEREKIAQVLELQSSAQNLLRAEGTAFQGPIQRQRVLKAQVSTLEIAYQGNDKWTCPLLTPNRVTYQCLYNKNATDSLQRQTQPVSPVVQPDLPPELPDDLKPQ